MADTAFAEPAPPTGVEQRWRNGGHAWRHVSEGGFDHGRYTVAPITEAVDVVDKSGLPAGGVGGLLVWCLTRVGDALGYFDSADAVYARTRWAQDTPLPFDVFAWRYHQEWSDHSMRNLLRSVFAVAQSPFIAETAERADRATRRRADRAAPNAPAPDSIRVLRLRRRPSTATSAGGDRASLSHRFPVRGHWRNQACGPARSERRPTYVAPYIKGPVDAPLVVRPTVHVLDGARP